ncbi:hypothetical protein [Microvirga roseola]|uniref:hypothetical protein n=1 Tax=Microvirga roseola TaxID=2883126 RepID=UPI001E43D821|nr:hypothetical protein [Microvirga roseola]
MKWLAALISCTLLSAPALAREIEPAERREGYLSATIPVCADPSVLAEISSDFATREDRFWHSGLRIVAYDKIRPVAWRAWGLDYIPRQFCTGEVLVSDGFRRRIDYVIKEDLGFIGIGWGTDFCIVGLDRNYGHAPRCRQAGP